MSKLQSIDLIVPDVPKAVGFFRDVVRLQVLQEFDLFAELEGGGIRIMLSPDAMVPTKNAQGTILHFEVGDVDEAASRAKKLGARILKEPFTTDWGTISALIEGPEGIVVDFYIQK